MIDKNIEEFILSRSDTFIVPAKNVAVLYAEHNIAHAKLLLSQYKYSRVPVLNNQKEYVGVLGLTEIVEFEMEHDFFYEKSQNTTISEIVNKEVPTLRPSATLEEIMNKLIKEPFLPVVKGQEFIGIIVRQEILKAFNAFSHDFTKYYEITKRN
ncbi:cyclic-di-AMP-binding protein CbpB [Lactococcus allomyrinae]|uniref:CBS domain-containing protein n=1 Tax=Lactococcus allomyrinae TaxID=2419773 RepID=A0A387BD21_9LACT|nr:cyclic-di-AMP-binding protein CbpB [Lactococcus allomyrinae]AYG00378.1 CBS domain-containing protein [Lactococcus allomyrinae]